MNFYWNSLTLKYSKRFTSLIWVIIYVDLLGIQTLEQQTTWTYELLLKFIDFESSKRFTSLKWVIIYVDLLGIQTLEQQTTWTYELLLKFIDFEI